MTRRKLLRSIAYAALMCLGCCVAPCTVFVFIVDWLDPFAGQAFDPQAWAVAKPEERAAMARDAIRYSPPGLPEA